MLSTMTVALVHGNPETDAIWGPLVDALGRDDVVRLSPPGFGAPLPDTFSATYLAYRDWLEDELEGLGEPVDVVGHDWGGGHVVNVVMHRPELVRSWATDVIGVFDPDYVWHELAQIWQTPGEGERWVDEMLGGKWTDRMVARGVPKNIATSIAAAQGPRWAERFCSCTVRPANPRWPRWAVRWRPPRPGQGCQFWPLRPSSATNLDAGRPVEREPAPRCLTD
jgi:pimeloyl-ACP methyl ester carboxylesterase